MNKPGFELSSVIWKLDYIIYWVQGSHFELRSVKCGKRIAFDFVICLVPLVTAYICLMAMTKVLTPTTLYI